MFLIAPPVVEVLHELVHGDAAVVVLVLSRARFSSPSPAFAKESVVSFRCRAYEIGLESSLEIRCKKNEKPYGTI